MSTYRFSRAPARLLFVVSLGLFPLSSAFAAEPSCDSKPSANPSHLPAPGSIEAWKMAKFPWLYLPRASASPSSTHFPEPGSAEAVRFYKAPYLYYPRRPASPEVSGKKWPEPGSAEAVRFYKTPYLASLRSATDPRN